MTHHLSYCLWIIILNHEFVYNLFGNHPKLPIYLEEGQKMGQWLVTSRSWFLKTFQEFFFSQMLPWKIIEPSFSWLQFMFTNYPTNYSFLSKKSDCCGSFFPIKLPLIQDIQVIVTQIASNNMGFWKSSAAPEHAFTCVLLVPQWPSRSKTKNRNAPCTYLSHVNRGCLMYLYLSKSGNPQKCLKNIVEGM